ncbi:uncharacterized protein LOC105828967 isoform X2 [Monomorium pharaonis]|uniref:uncharacterized protein LOC105828967 isoform X2 n=1 Tax=Monomorium pharaonis TaxID=307658 RepID=UPI001746B76D|nr:uncharacterized protein LOC105828967 isoform X2 [Monomorium pharaonis]
MDCCNYIEGYAAGGHFYQQQQQQQQQQYFCYDNGSVAYTGYDAAPISNAIDINARYNGAIPPAYPTDYVYNPKEARLRKAMREQTRELSRRSILQNAIATANARTAAIGGTNSAVSMAGFLNQHHRFDCTPMPMGPNVSPHQTVEPWFQAAHRMKPAHSPRIGDWYGNVCGDPIERLQAMGAMHQHHHHHQQQQQQQQQRDLEKPIKDQRSQAAECAAASFSNGYSPDIAEREIRRQESAAEYADFAEGQKWHPYQNSASPHPLPRTPHPSPQMGGVLHPSVQNTNAHGHGPWGQFCHGMLPHVPSVARNAASIRGPRHAVFLRDRTPTRHCAFLEDASPMNYAPSKLNIDSIRASYPPSEHQMPRLLGSTVDSVIDSTTTTTTTTTAAMGRREEDGGTRWEPNNPGMSLELVPTSTPQPEGTVPREKEREPRHSSERFELRRKPVSKQPLPGFHQAFGSTEIGKFSRSEFFVNMVGESSSSGSVTADDGDGADGGDDGDVSREQPLSEAMEDNGTAAAAAAAAATAATAATAAAVTASTTGACRIFDAEDSQAATFAVGDDDAVGAPPPPPPPSVGAGAYCGEPAAPRWHSPHVGVIGSEI